MPHAALHPGPVLPHEHRHRGLELTCVLSGAYHDGDGMLYSAGDVSEEDGDDEDEDLYSGSSSSNARPARQNFGPSQTEQMYGIRKSAEHAPRRSVEQQRYDSDPHVLDDSEFSRLELRDDEARKSTCQSIQMTT